MMWKTLRPLDITRRYRVPQYLCRICSGSSGVFSQIRLWTKNEQKGHVFHRKKEQSVYRKAQKESPRYGGDDCQGILSILEQVSDLSTGESTYPQILTTYPQYGRKMLLSPIKYVPHIWDFCTTVYIEVEVSSPFSAAISSSRISISSMK